ncbi:MAG TPA: type I methionyl aminopeptidase [bacterium]|nr:type I methionyl aminopeptidase [bacterium]
MNSKVISLKTPEQVEKLRRANRIVAEVLQQLKERAAAGMSTQDLDDLSVDICHRHKVKPAFLGLYGYPRALCISLNEEVVHGIPSKERILREGDLVSVDFGVIYDGFYGDAAISFGIGRVDDETTRLMNVTEESLMRGIEQARVGNRLYDISAAVQRHVERHGFSVVRDFVGHGIGSEPHEPPQVPNFGTPGTGVRLKAGMVLALEPMVAAGDWPIRMLADGWTAVTADGSLAAHFEHSIVINEDGPEILSQLD